MTITELDRFRGCLLGLAVGDAIGTSVEFQPRGTFPPLTDMIGQGPFNLKRGQWTDDTSMALCLATSLIHKNGFDAVDQMNRYCNWYEQGYLSSTGVCFDIGNTVRQALHRYKQTGDPFSGSSDPQAAGNGSLMRLAPAPMFFFSDRNRIMHFSAESSRTTHGAAECIDACLLFGDMLYRALAGRNKDEILFGGDPDTLASPSIKAIARGEYRNKTEKNIHGTGYVVHSLEAALWCFLNAETFEQTILKAANLGDDADTTAAIAGQIAGAYHAASAIPARWLEWLTMREEIGKLADQLHSAHSTR